MVRGCCYGGIRIGIFFSWFWNNFAPENKSKYYYEIKRPGRRTEAEFKENTA